MISSCGHFARYICAAEYWLRSEICNAPSWGKSKFVPVLIWTLRHEDL